MSLNKIIAVFVIIFILFSGLVIFQFSRRNSRTTNVTNVTNVTKTEQQKGTAKATINNKTFTVTEAKTPQEQQKGLSGVPSMGQDEGMLFRFNTPGYTGFWMRDMKFPLDIIFIRGDKVVSFAENAQPLAADKNTPIYTPEAPSDKVLEINAGLVKKFNIKKGDTVSIK